MAWNIYPTETPVGDWSGDDCDRAREFQHADWMNYLRQSPLHSFRCSGGVFTLAGDYLNIPTGIYIIDGRAVENDAAEALDISALGRPAYLFARLTMTGTAPTELATAAEYFANDTGAAPAEPYVMIGQIGAGDVVTMSSAYPRAVTGTTQGTIFLGFPPSLVMVEHTPPVGDHTTKSSLATITAWGFTLSVSGTVRWTAWA